MKKFKFSLEKVLSLREFEENQAQIELAKAISVVTELNNKLKFIANERVKNNDARSNYIEGLDYQKEILLEELAQAELILEEKRQIMIEAMKKRKALEKLKEKQLQEYKKEILKEEEKVLDEIKNNLTT